MELTELERRLSPFAQAMYEDAGARVHSVHPMPGHAGFAYGFTVLSLNKSESWFLRLPPPNVKWQGTADVLRQVAVLNALDSTDVPHCSVKWSGDDLQWFERPYFVVPKLEGDVIRMDEGGWTRELSTATRHAMARQAIQALAGVHRLEGEAVAPYLLPAVALDEDVSRWDRFVDKAADPERLLLVPEVRSLLLNNIPRTARSGIYHGDFQWANLFFSPQGRLLALIDWELTGLGAVLNDLGWIATFNDPLAWASNRRPGDWMPQADELVVMYQEAWGERLPDLAWFRALAAYKFAIISGFNLMLHRRGKRQDPVWEVSKESIEPLLTRAKELLV